MPIPNGKPTFVARPPTMITPHPAKPATASPINSLADLQKHEVSILQTINQTRNGPELFLSDPFRFLSEHGFPVAQTVQQDLTQRSTGIMAKMPAQMYDAVRDGRASLASTANYHVRFNIRSLGLAQLIGGIK